MIWHPVFPEFLGLYLARLQPKVRLRMVRKRRGSWDHLALFLEPESWHHGFIASNRPDKRQIKKFRDSVANQQPLLVRAIHMTYKASREGARSARLRAKCRK